MNRNTYKVSTLLFLAVLSILALVGCSMISSAAFADSAVSLTVASPAGGSNGSTDPATATPSSTPSPGQGSSLPVKMQPSSDPTLSPTVGSKPPSNPPTVQNPPPSPLPGSNPSAGPVSTPYPVPVYSPTPTPVLPAPTPTPSQSPAPKPTTTPTPSPVPSPKSTPVPPPTPTPAPPPTPVPTPATVPPPSGKVVLGYYGGWAAFSGYTPDKIPASSLTHLDYAFAKIGSDMKITVDDPSVDPGNLSALYKLKNVNPNLKILISVGGWNDSGRFSDMASTDDYRSIFADSAVEFILKYRLDGIDIDWEYPVSGGQSTNSSSPSDKQNFTLLLETLREKLDEQGAKDGKHYWLTIAGSAGGFYARNTELSKISKYIDYALVMTYDIHGNWEAYTDFNAPLYTPSEPSPQFKWSDEAAVRMYSQYGFPADKLVLGIPFYGYVYSGVTNANNGIYQTFSKGNTASYDNIQSKYASDPSFNRFTSSAGEPWLFNGSTLISFDDSATMLSKTDYVKSHGLAGAGIWEISQNRNGTLVKSIYQALR